MNNIYVSAHNHGWDASAYLAALPPARDRGNPSRRPLACARFPAATRVRLDDHASPVIADVWALYQEALRRFGPIPTLIEWDNDVPPLDVLLGEAQHAAALMARVGSGGNAMPTLLEVQHAMRASLVVRDDAAAASMLDATVSADRLNIYRNTFVAGADTHVATGLSGRRPPGRRGFLRWLRPAPSSREHPPRMAWLDQYGAEFPDFLRNFEPAASLVYLAGRGAARMGGQSRAACRG